MKFTIALLAATASQSVSAFRVPEGAPAGVYMAYYNADGNEVHERIGDIAPPSGTIISRNPTFESNMFKRNQAWCGCDIHMPGGNCDDATHDIERQLGGGKLINPVAAYYSNRGAVTAFICNHSRQPQFASSQDARNAWSGVTRACGFYIAGTWEIGGDLEGGYMLSGQDFCGRDRGSNKHHC